MDMDHEALIRYVNRLNEDVNGIQRIINIFMKLKNDVMYDSIKKSEQLASETLVMGYGNNFSKNNLLCAVLQMKGYECQLKYKNVTDNTNWVFSRNRKVIPWYYVSVDYFGKVLNLDCSFDRSFMSAARIVHKGDKLDYELENYYFIDGSVFEVVNDPFQSEVTVTKLERYELGRGKLCI
jgi:hypothetical protein